MSKSQGCVICYIQVIRQTAPPKVIEFSMEMPCWCTAAVHQHVGQNRGATTGVFFGYLKCFLLFSELANIHMQTSLIILGVQTSKTQGELLFSCMWHFSQQPSYVASVTCFEEIWSSNCSTLKTKHATELMQAGMFPICILGGDEDKILKHFLNL